MAVLSAKREVRTDLSYFSRKDEATALRQMEGRNFDSSIVRAVAARCPWGKPQVLACSPLSEGHPFPTLFWLCCPYLAYRCGVLESVGGVKEFESFLNQDPSAYIAYNKKYALTRLSFISETEKLFLRKYRPKLWKVLCHTGIGGIRPAGRATAKCLHLQSGTMLALSGHPGEKWLREHIGCTHCSDGCGCQA